MFLLTREKGSVSFKYSTAEPKNNTTPKKIGKVTNIV